MIYHLQHIHIKRGNIIESEFHMFLFLFFFLDWQRGRLSTRMKRYIEMTSPALEKNTQKTQKSH